MENNSPIKGYRNTLRVLLFRRFVVVHQDNSRSVNMLLLVLFALFFSTFSVPARCQDLLGEGSSESPYIIKDKTDMDKLADFVNEGGSTNGKFFKVSADYSSVESITKVIGNSDSKVFEGNFDGNGVWLDLDITSGNYSGLFGCVGGNAIICNVNTTGRVSGAGYCAGIAAMLTGSAYIKIIDCNNEASITGTSDYAGGIVGYSSVDFSITNCQNTGFVTGVDNVGGIIGYSKHTMLHDVVISKCKNTGSINGHSNLGGIIGNDYCGHIIIDGCDNSEYISSSGKNTGGIIGEASIGTTITNCSNDGTMSGEDASNVGGIAGYVHDEVAILNCTNNAYITVSSYAGGIVGRTYNNKKPVTISGCTNKATIISKSYAGGIAAELFYKYSKISNCKNDGWVTSSVAVGGIVGTMYEGTEILSCTNTESSKVNGANGNVGGIAGSAINGLIDECCNYGNVTCTAKRIGGIAGNISNESRIINSFNKGTISGTSPDATGIGGIAGGCEGTNSSSMSKIENCYNTGNVSGEERKLVAGIAGVSKYGSIANCYNGGNVSGYRTSIVCDNRLGSTIMHCYYKSEWYNPLCTKSDSEGVSSDCTCFAHDDVNSTECSLCDELYGTKILCDALNKWVVENNGSGIYKAWKHDTGFENLGMPIHDPNDIILPIEIYSFEAECEGSYVSVFWTTASERNNDYFILQHSIDAVNFTDISKISAAGNSIEMTDYSFVDYDAISGNNYYRLVQVDFDGRHSISEIIEASCSAEKLESPALTVYPSEVSEYVNIILENFYRQDVNIEIYDMLGRLVFSKTVNVEYNYQLTLDVSFLPPAMYNVRANSKDIVLTSKIIKGNL